MVEVSEATSAASGRRRRNATCRARSPRPRSAASALRRELRLWLCRSSGRARSAPIGSRDRRDRSGPRPAPRTKSRIGEIFVAVGIGEPHRFGDQMPAGRDCGPKRRQVEPLELLQDREHRRPARRRRPHPADPVVAIGAADRRPRLGVVGGDVAGRHRRRIVRRSADRGGDRLGIGADVETVRARAPRAARGRPRMPGCGRSSRPAAACRPRRRTAPAPVPTARRSRDTGRASCAAAG